MVVERRRRRFAVEKSSTDLLKLYKTETNSFNNGDHRVYINRVKKEGRVLVYTLEFLPCGEREGAGERGAEACGGRTMPSWTSTHVTRESGSASTNLSVDQTGQTSRNSGVGLCCSPPIRRPSLVGLLVLASSRWR